VAEGLAQGSHSNRSRLRRDAGANSSKVGIPWKIRWDEVFSKPLLISQEGAFFIPAPSFQSKEPKAEGAKYRGIKIREVKKRRL